jgi:hypothetical protein
LPRSRRLSNEASAAISKVSLTGQIPRISHCNGLGARVVAELPPHTALKTADKFGVCSSPYLGIHQTCPSSAVASLVPAHLSWLSG